MKELAYPMNNLSKWLAVGLVGLSVAMTGCGGKQNAGGTTPNTTGTTAPAKISGTVTAAGSTALLPMVQRAKEIFEDANAGATVNVSGGGSFTGLTQVASGAVEIGNSDVPATGDAAKDLVGTKVAVAPFVFIVPKDFAVNSLTLEEYAKIMKGEITNWKDVKGPDQKITVVSRQQSSGSRATIVATVLKGQGDISKDALVQDSNGKVAETVTSTPGAIGYVDAAYAKPDKMKVLQLNGVAYAPEAVTGGKWPVFAYEYMYTKGEAKGVAKALIDLIMSPDFQNNEVAKLGFVPMGNMPK
jgi:phosphate transport system substrate-binding protein